MTDDKIARLRESVRLTLADAQERCDRNETLPLECGCAVVKVARVAFNLCREQAFDLAALRERLAKQSQEASREA